MSKKRIDDGLTKWERYRLKDVEAYRKLKREYAKTPEERAKRVEYQRKWREKNRERHNELARESHRRNSHKHKEKRSDYHLIKKYGITLEQKNQMVKDQNSKCLICSEPFKTTNSTHVDHDHATGQIRGILCHTCNTKLGWYEANKTSIKKYLND